MPDQTIILFPSRLKASGTVTLAAGATDTYSGEDGRQKRRQFIVTNLDSTLTLQLVLSNGTPFITVFAQSSVTVETTDNIGVKNPDGSSTVDYQVCEIFYDPGVVPFVKPGYSPLGSGMRVASGGSGSAGGSYPGSYAGVGQGTKSTQPQ